MKTKALYNSIKKFMVVRAYNIIGKLYKSEKLPSNIIFIIGCGRSGTTILGKMIQMHKEVLYLNEPRYMWMACFPETDIWSKCAPTNGGKLFLDHLSKNSTGKTKLTKILAFLRLITKSDILIEKLPVNCFRLHFINKLFPHCRFIYIHRNPNEVARSIEKMCVNTKWYGFKSYKWRQFVDYYSNKMMKDQILDGLSNYEKGLIEWFLSNYEVIKFLDTIDDDRLLELDYSELVNTPDILYERISEFIGVCSSESVREWALNNIARQTNHENNDKIYTFFKGKFDQKEIDCVMN